MAFLTAFNWRNGDVALALSMGIWEQGICEFPVIGGKCITSGSRYKSLAQLIVSI